MHSKIKFLDEPGLKMLDEESLLNHKNYQNYYL